MKKNTVSFLFALCPLVPAASRFGYGIILCLTMIWLFITGLLLRELVKKIDPDGGSSYIELACVGGSATFFFLVLQGLFPILSISLGLYVYLCAFSFLILTSVDSFSMQSSTELPLVSFIPVLLILSAVRELFSYGTLSVPVPNGLFEIALIPNYASLSIGFWGTAGGSLILLGGSVWLIQFLRRRSATFRGKK